MQGTHEWFLLTDNHVSFSSKLGTLTLILYILQFLPSVKKTSKWETKLEAYFPHIYFSRSHHQKCEILCVSVCLCMMGIKLSVLPMLNKHSCTELHPKARNVEILWYLLTMGSLSREGSCWLPTLLLSQAISLHIFNYWGPEVYIALLQTSGIQKCCLVQWASKALTAARWKMFQYKQTSWKPRAAKTQWLLLWPGPPDSPKCELLLSKYLPKERHSVTMTLSKSAEILCGCFLSRMAKLNSMEHRT